MLARQVNFNGCGAIDGFVISDLREINAQCPDQITCKVLLARKAAIEEIIIQESLLPRCVAEIAVVKLRASQIRSLYCYPGKIAFEETAVAEVAI